MGPRVWWLAGTNFGFKIPENTQFRVFGLCSKYAAKHLRQGTITQWNFVVSRHYKNEDRERSSGCMPGVRFSTRRRGFLYCQVKAFPGAVWPHI